MRFASDTPKTCQLIISMITMAIIFSPCGLARGQEKKRKQPPTNYLVDFSQAKNHYINVTITIPVESDKTELMMAVWTPGSYLVREYARHIDEISVSSAGEPVPFRKTKKNRWLVETHELKKLKVKYRLYCNEMSVRTNWVGKNFGMINGAPTFLTVVGRLDRPHVVQLKLPKNWSRSATSLVAHGNSPHRYKANNFDELVDSPIVAGNIRIYPFEVGNVPHQLVNIGESGIWDGTKAATDLKKIVEAHHKMWGNIPYERYLFLNMICESGGGLEHDNSTLIMTSRWSYRDSSRYESWLSLASHEFFHTWNVRRLRPKSLRTYDYENEVYTPSLWIAEGITSYYADLLLARAGLSKDSEYLPRLSRNIETVQRTVGRKVQSLRDSSFDTWIKFYRPDENSSNTRISYYSKGAVAAFLLDAKIRKLTNGEKSLDDVMRRLYDQFVESGYTTKDFRQTVDEVAGKDLAIWFRRSIDSTKELDYSDLEFLGVAVPNQAATESKDRDNSQPDASKTESGGKAKNGSPKKSQPKKPTPRPWVGISMSSDGTVSRVTPDSPGHKAGINVDDEIIAVNDFRVGSSLDSRIKQYQVGEEIELLIARRGRLMRFAVVPGTRASENWRLKFIAKPTPVQQKQKSKWLKGN